MLDYDNDGWLDLYLLNGSTVPAMKGQEAPPRAMLLHNNHVTALNHDGLDRIVTVQEGNEVSPSQNSSSLAIKPH